MRVDRSPSWCCTPQPGRSRVAPGGAGRLAAADADADADADEGGAGRVESWRTAVRTAVDEVRSDPAAVPSVVEDLLRAQILTTSLVSSHPQRMSSGAGVLSIVSPWGGSFTFVRRCCAFTPEEEAAALHLAAAAHHEEGRRLGLWRQAL